MASFRDSKWVGDTIQRTVFLVDRATGMRRDLSGYTATYSARVSGGTGSASFTASATGNPGQTEITPLVTGDKTATPGHYDAWVHLHSGDGTLELSLQGILDIYAKPS